MMPNGSRWVAVVAATLSVVAMASEPVPSQSTPGGPLLFRVVLPRPDVCLGQRHLEAEVELRNTSTHAVSLAPAGIGAQVSFLERLGSIEDGIRATGRTAIPDPRWKGGRVVRLKAGESFRSVFDLDLDPAFFKPGVYSVQVSYSGQLGAGGRKGVFSDWLTANEVLFEVAECPALDPTGRR